MSSSSTSSSEAPPRVQVRRSLKQRIYRKRPYYNMLQLIRDFSATDEVFAKTFGVTQSQFQSLYGILRGQVNISLTKFRDMQSIRCRDRLALYLRFLATGESFKFISTLYNLRPGVMETINREVSIIITQFLRPMVMPHPTNRIWESIIKGFRTVHDMPNCIGSLNGRYVNIVNQKLYTFLALVDAHHRFIMVELCEFDGNPQKIWARSAMSRRIYSNELNIPENRSPGKNYPPLPFVIVGGNTFPSEARLISKFKEIESEGNVSRTIYNCRIKDAKQMADDALTRLRRRWRIIQCTFPVAPEMAERMLVAICCLENFLSGPPI